MDTRKFYVYVSLDAEGYYSVHYTTDIISRINKGNKKPPLVEYPKVFTWWPAPNYIRRDKLKKYLLENMSKLQDIMDSIPSGTEQAHIIIPSGNLSLV